MAFHQLNNEARDEAVGSEAAFDHTRLRPDELYAGIVDGADGPYHLIVLPGEARNVTWQQAKAFAAVIGGHLPSVQEHDVLMESVRGEFTLDSAYWSSSTRDTDSAFYLDFSGTGHCDYESIDAGLRARAVRRVRASQRQQGGAHA
jgi:hypothetical protein